MKTNLKLCPACNENVEYEDYDGQLFCSLCGRSEKAAEELVLQEKKNTNQKKIQIVGFALVVIFVLLSLITGFGKTTTITTIASVIPTVAILYIAYKLINRKNKKVGGSVEPIETYKEYTKFNKR
jgi:hypothetical protein